MKKEIIYVPLDKIKLIANLKASDAYLKRMKKTEEDLLVYDLLLAVEKIQGSDEYLLVGGYDRYHHMISVGKENAPCIIEELSISPNEQGTKILRRLFNNGDSIKENRQIILDLLNRISVTLNFIIKKTGFTNSELKNNYNYHINIPNRFINEHTSEKTMNWIENLSCSIEVKNFLYERAGLPIGDPKRLTHDNVKLIKIFLKQEPRFNYLTPSEQEKILSYAINFKGMIIHLLKSMVSDYYKPQKIVWKIND